MGLGAAAILAAVSAHGQANPAVRPPQDLSPFVGVWNGAHLEQRSGCTTATNNGFHGTYSQYTVSLNTVSRIMGIAELALTGLYCSYSGPYRDEPGRFAWSGSMQCTDNRAGSFEAESLFAVATVMRIRMTIRLEGSETCVIDAVLSGARF
jgi:hypothetical protein